MSEQDMDPRAQELSRFRQGTLQWIGENIAGFVPGPLEAGKTDLRRKALGELALTLLVLSRFKASRERPQIAAALTILQVHACRADFNRSTLIPGLFRLHLLIMVALESADLATPGLREHIHAALALRSQDGVESTPWQDISMKFLLDTAQIANDYPPVSELYQRSTLSRLPWIPYLRDHDAYALTHQIFFLSEFAAEDLRLTLGDKHADTCDYVRALLGAYVLRGHWDLVGELLICCECLDCATGGVYDAAWSRLMAAQHPSGYVHAPARVTDDASERHLQVDAFELYYHPTLVGLLAASLASDRTLRT